jgi:sugar lactone lactonase YvrE
MKLIIKKTLLALAFSGCLLSGCSSLNIEGTKWSIKMPPGPAQSGQLCVDQEGNLYAQTNANGKVAIEKLNFTGESKWKTSLPDEFLVSSIDGCSLQRVLVASMKFQQQDCSASKPPKDYFRLLSLAKTGKVEWEVDHGVSDLFAIYDLTEDSLGNAYVLLSQWHCIDGVRQEFADAVLVSFDPKGQLRYSNSYSLSGGFPISLAVDSLNNVYMGGSYLRGHFLTALDKRGEPRWHIFDSDSASGSIEGMAFAGDGHLYTCGSSNGKLLVQKYDTQGHRLWAYQDPQSSVSPLAKQCISAGANSVYVMGEQFHKNELTVLKLDSDGALREKLAYKIPPAFITDMDSRKGSGDGVSIGGFTYGGNDSPFYIRIN